MMTRPFIILLAGSLLAATTAAADRRRSRDRHDDDDTARAAKRSIGGEDRRRAARSIERDEDEDDAVADEKVTKRRRRTKRARVAEPEAADSDGPEAEAVLPLKLDDLIEVAIRNAPDLARKKLDRLAAKGDAGAARLDQAWVLTARASYRRKAVGGDVEVEPLTTVSEDQTEAGLGLGRKLPTGGSLALDLGFHRIGREIAITKELIDNINGADKAPTEDIQEFATSHQTVASLTYKQPILRGVGTDAALAKEKKADLALTEATIATQLAAEKMVLEVVTAYWELAAASDEVNVRLDSLELAQRHERLTREEIRAGASPSSALNAVVFEIATREEARIRAETEYERKSMDLRRKAGLEITTRSLVLRPGEPFAVGNEEYEVADVLKRSHQTNRRMVLLAMQQRSADLDVKVASNAMLPQVDVTLQAGLMGSGRSTDEAFSNASGASGYQVMVGLDVQFEISGAARQAHKAAVARRSKVHVDRLDVQRQIDTEVVAAVAAVKSARVRVALAEKAIAMAEENVKAERAQFQAQRSSNFDVMKRQSELAESTLRRGRAIADYHIAVAQLQYASGMILDQYRVNVRTDAGRT